MKLIILKTKQLCRLKELHLDNITEESDVQVWRAGSYKDLINIISQAKEIFEEQIIESNLVGQEIATIYVTTGKTPQTAKQYYNETYKINK